MRGQDPDVVEREHEQARRDAAADHDAADHDADDRAR
jgi:hypothetical protein